MAKIGNNTFIAPNAIIVGDVEIGDGVSIWYGTVIRADLNKVVIQKNANIQDNVVIHVSKEHGTFIGENASIGHLAMVHGSMIENNVIIGIGAVTLNGSEIGEGSIVSAGAVVTERSIIPPRSLVMGIPAKIVRSGIDIEKTAIENGEEYQRLRELHKNRAFERV
jgi:carbonic anhydrase/acetyltransferase-like protein (isoleucine patch superfamily)